MNFENVKVSVELELRQWCLLLEALGLKAFDDVNSAKEFSALYSRGVSRVDYSSCMRNFSDMQLIFNKIFFAVCDDLFCKGRCSEEEETLSDGDIAF